MLFIQPLHHSKQTYKQIYHKYISYPYQKKLTYMNFFQKNHVVPPLKNDPQNNFFPITFNTTDTETWNCLTIVLQSKLALIMHLTRRASICLIWSGSGNLAGMRSSG